MAFAYFIISLKILVTGFFIYRVQRFLITHRTWEIGAAFLIFVSLASIAITDSSSAGNIHHWLPIALAVFVSLAALEPELAHVTNRLMQNLNPNSLIRKGNVLEEIARAANALAVTKTGALIAFERNDSLLKFGQTGIEINADIKKELLTTLFTKDTPTHDGGVLIRNGRLSHCGAIFPLSERRQIENGLGTRHRAALGLTEKTDAVCLVVSEEEGSISLAKEGELIYSVSPRQLEAKIRKLLSSRKRVRYYPLHYLRRVSPKSTEANFVQFSKSLGQNLYELTGAIFWLLVLLLLNSYGMVPLASFREPLKLLLNAPWAYAPLALLGLNLGAFFLSRNLVMNGITNEVTEQHRFLFVPIFQRRISGSNLSGIALKRESLGRNLWSLALVMNKKRRMILIDRTSSAKAIADSARKIRDVLRLELMT